MSLPLDLIVEVHGLVLEVVMARPPVAAHLIALVDPDVDWHDQLAWVLSLSLVLKLSKLILQF